MNMGLLALLALVFFVMLIVLLAGGFVQRAFFYPDRLTYGSPADQGVAFEEVLFSGEDGVHLHAWFLPAAADCRCEARGTVLHFHGNAQNISSHWEYSGWLVTRGFNVFIFDYKGYGKSEGKPSIKGLCADSRAALDYIRTRPDVDASKLLIFGQSLGGTNAIAAVVGSNRSGIRAIAIEATFYSYSSIAHDKLPGAGWLVGDYYSAANNIAKLAPIPLLFIHGTNDGVISVNHTERLYATASEPKRMLLIPGSGHIEAMLPAHGDRYKNELVAFFQEALRPREGIPRENF